MIWIIKANIRELTLHHHLHETPIILAHNPWLPQMVDTIAVQQTWRHLHVFFMQSSRHILPPFLREVCIGCFLNLNPSCPCEQTYICPEKRTWATGIHRTRYLLCAWYVVVRAMDWITTYRTKSCKLVAEAAEGVSPQRAGARSKLTKLSNQQFHELSTDVYDELMRRNADDRMGM
jgi:hypothetical protein